MHILLVDDDQINAKMLQKRFEKRGFIVTCLDSGVKCLEFLQNETPDIILLDVIMPEMGGLAVLENIRKVYSMFDIPVIMVTANIEVEDTVIALEMGANDYIRKPVNIDIAVARINTQIFACRNYREALEKRELESMNALIAMYNHEINNPLTIAFGYLRKAKKEQSCEYFDQIVESLQRVTKIVKEIERITDHKMGKVDHDLTQKYYKLPDT